VTNPPGPQYGDPTSWGRPGNQGPPDRPDAPTQEAQVPRPGSPMDAPAHYTSRPGAPGGPTQQIPSAGPPAKKHRLRDPLSIVLILVIVVAVIAAGLLGAEIYARHKADGKVTAAAECVSEDNVSVSFSSMPPFLWQHVNGHYDNITMTTAGNQIQSAKGMKAQVSINDVDLHGDADSKGTIGALDATITWTAEGIKETLQDQIPVVGSFVGDVTTNASDGTITLDGTFGDIVAKPQVVDNKIKLQVVTLSGLGFVLPSESVQPALDEATDKFANELPLGIKADTIQVTDSGVVGQFSTRNAKIPLGEQNPCFANV
jgi:hypothetical protein